MTDERMPNSQAGHEEGSTNDEDAPRSVKENRFMKGQRSALDFENDAADKEVSTINGEQEDGNKQDVSTEEQNNSGLTPPETEPDKASLDDRLVFNFDNAELSEVIRTLADLLEINYVLDKGVSGKVTIHTAGELSRKDLFPIFYQILEINGITAVKDKNFYRIVPLKDAARLPIMTHTRMGAAIQPGDRVIIQVIPLISLAAPEMTKLLTPFVSPEGAIVSQDSRNLLVVVERADNIDKILRLVKVFDTDVFGQVNYRFYPLSYADSEDIIKTMDNLFVPYGDSIKNTTSLISITRLNTLLVVSLNPKVFDIVDAFLLQYDVPSLSTEPGIYVYPLINGRAADITEILDSVFSSQKNVKEKDKIGSGTSGIRNPLAKEVREEEKSQPAAQPPSPASSPMMSGTGGAIGSGTLRDEINITADESRNALIIEATPSDYHIIKNLLKQLDIMPRQVVIEVTIAEITLDESTAMGVEWSYLKGDKNLSTSMLEATMGKSGLNFTVGNPDRWTAALSALATENKVNILSNPSVLASNSMPASIDVSQEIPVASSQYQYTTGNDALLETDIQYRDTGIMLSVTPNINENGLVTMDIDQEISEQASNVSVGGKDYPSFFKRKIVTTLTVQSGQTIVIGGLIKETTSDGVSGAPWFTRIPVLSFLFGRTSDSISKTELVILISPYVIATSDDVDAVTREFTSKIKSLPQHLQ